MNDEELVEVKVSEYEWTCPQCGDLNKEYEYRNQYFCSKCGKLVHTDYPPEHALDA